MFCKCLFGKAKDRGTIVDNSFIKVKIPLSHACCFTKLVEFNQWSPGIRSYSSRIQVMTITCLNTMVKSP